MEAETELDGLLDSDAEEDADTDPLTEDDGELDAEAEELAEGDDDGPCHKIPPPSCARSRPPS